MIFALAVAMAMLIALPASAQNQYLGDVNRDGAINVQDVQATIAQALDALAPSADADLDEDAAVDVLDVQNMVNSVLGTGGLVQQVVGTINAPGNCQNLWMVGLSNQGLLVKAKVDPDTGQFVLRLRTKTAWALMLCRAFQQGSESQLHVLATLRLRLGDGGEGGLLPLMNLGRRELNFGLMDLVQNRLEARETIQRMLGELAGRLDGPDENGNGIPDFVEPLLERLRDGAPGIPHNTDIEGLKDLIRPCVAAWMEDGVNPDLTDENENGIPDFVEPLLTCIREALAPWLAERGIVVPQQDQNQNGIPDFIDGLMAHIRNGLRECLSQMGPAELVDENENGIPDFIEEHIGRIGTPGPMDSDGDGIPNFAEDNDGDGIPNCEDPDCSMGNDDDCDGIPNAYDWDRNNNGKPDYAE